MSPQQPQSLDELLSRLLDGPWTETDAARLTELLRGDPQARAAYHEYMQLHAMLHWKEGKPLGSEAAEGSSQAPLAPAPSSPVLGFLNGLLHDGGASPIVNGAMLLVIVLGFSLTLVMLVGLMLTLRHPQDHLNGPEVAQGSREQGAGSGEKRAEAANPHDPASQGARIPNPSPVARLTRVADCRWAAAGDAPQPGDELKPGRRLTLASGLAEIIFHDGASSVLEGPATLEIVSAKSAQLDQGKFAVTIENPSARGFVVHTPGMKVTDLGTEFGVLVAEDGRQEVHVFRGRVRAEEAEGGKSLDSAPSAFPLPPSPLLLTAHQAICVAQPGRPAERIAADQKWFVRTEQMTAQVAAADERARPAAKVVWKEIGDAPGVVGMAAADKRLFAATAEGKLLICDPAAAMVQWKPIGDAPRGVVAMALTDGKLFVSTDVRARGRLLTRDVVETAAAWKDIGHAWCLVGMAGVPGKLYGAIDTREPGSQPGIMVRDTVGMPQSLAKAAGTAPGLDGLPWTATRFPPLAGLCALAEAGKKLFVATNDGRLLAGDPARPDIQWRPIGDAPGVTILAGGDGRLFAVTRGKKLLVGEMKQGAGNRE